MEGLISLLLFAAFFYLMMRFGCGAHMVHGHGGGREAGARHKDPVCGMDVVPKQGYGNSSAWRVLYMSQQLGDLATTGAYAGSAIHSTRASCWLCSAFLSSGEPR